MADLPQSFLDFYEGDFRRMIMKRFLPDLTDRDSMVCG